MNRFGVIEPIRSKTETIPYEMRDPHYTDERFTRRSGGLTIFLASGLEVVQQFGVDHVEGAFYNYSDRIRQGFGYVKVRTAIEKAQEEVGNDDTALFYETWLKDVYDDPTVELQHIITGVKPSDGYSYQVYGTMSGSSSER
jgi:hypothetical protein